MTGHNIAIAVLSVALIAVLIFAVIMPWMEEKNQEPIPQVDGIHIDELLDKLPRSAIVDINKLDNNGEDEWDIFYGINSFYKHESFPYDDHIVISLDYTDEGVWYIVLIEPTKANDKEADK